MLDVFVATVNLVDMINLTGTFGTHGGNQHRDTRADIRAGHVIGFELSLMVMTDNNRSVRVAEDDLRTHIDQFVHEEQTRLKHLLVNQHGAFGLRSHDK